MGNRDSRIEFLGYEDAVKRVSNDELERIRTTFKRHSGNGTLLSKSIFISEVLCGLVPSRLAEQLFMTCGGFSKGISLRDVIVILVLITKGTVDEKIRFLFCLMSVDGTVITREDLENFYNACDGEGSIPPCVNEAFWKHDKLLYQEFFDWVSANTEFSGVTRWLLEEQRGGNIINLSCTDDTPSFYHSLASITKLSEKEVIELEKRYWQMKATSKTGKFDFEVFKSHVHPPLPQKFIQSYFHFFDKNNDDHVDFKEMVCGISTCCRGLTSERLIACFEMFDCDVDGLLNKDELTSMAEGLIDVYQQYNDTLVNISVDELIQELSGEEMSLIDVSKFRPWASTSILIHEFLLLLSQICHIMFGLKPSLQEEEGCIVRRWLDREKKKGLQPGALHYIVTMNWWNSWKAYVNFDCCGVKESLNITDSLQKNQCDAPVVNNISTLRSNDEIKSNDQLISNGHSLKSGKPPVPGSIENTVLIQPVDTRKLMVLTGEGGKLKKNIILIHGKDYETLPEPIWRSMFTWYGGDVALPRVVLTQRNHLKPELELYPIQVFIYKHTIPPKSSGFSLNSLGINNIFSQIFGGGTVWTHSSEQPTLVTPKKTLTYRASFSRENTVKQIVEFIGQKLKIHPDDLRLWIMKDHESDIILLEEEEKNVEQLQFKEGLNLLLEVRNRDLSWPEEMNSLVATRNFRERSNTGLLEKGATGLHNLGNTCFMNSAVQCLSNTKPLTQYFCSKLFMYELNKTNPLGMKGILAKRYGDLVTDLWNGIYRSIAPVKLRWTIGRYAPRFNGFQQQDSQELISFLLDGLHEDVNRVHDKPYVELKDSDGRPDGEVADEAWENHVKRNQSIIVDLFQGQLKSQVKCLHCGYASVRFDPFTFLSLPLPMESSIHVEIPVFHHDGRPVIKYGLLLQPDATVKTAKRELSKLCNVSHENLLLVEVVGSTVRNFLLDIQKLKSTAICYIYAYETTNCYYEQDNNCSAFKKTSLNSSSTGDSTSNSSVNVSVSSTTVVTNIGNTDTYQVFDEQQPTVLKNELVTVESTSSLSTTSNISKARIKPLAKKTKNLFRGKTKVVEVSPKVNLTSTIPGNKGSTEVLEVPGIVNASFSPTHTSSIKMSASTSTECVLDNNFHGLVIAMSRKLVQSTTYFLSWQKSRPIVFGIPGVLSCSNETKNEDIYEMVWKHTSRYTTGDTIHKHEEKYPFQIKCVDKDGNYCIICPWYRFCRGCLIPCDDSYFQHCSSYLAIDWDTTTLHLQYQQGLEKNFTSDESVEESHKRLQEPISLDQCLKDFTKEEELGEDETWYCSKCKEHRTIAKKFDIWKLPAILVIHLKRFQLVNNRWVKSNKVVRFPPKDFDPSCYLAESKQHQINLEKKNVENTNVDVNEVDNLSSENLSDGESGKTATQECRSPPLCININSSFSAKCRYNLYAISCHSGMLNGGHYTAYAKNLNSKWYHYNDSSCKEVDSKVLENESPYMLFYEKQELNPIHYMPDIKEKKPVNVQQEEDEFEKEVKKYCTIM